MVHVEHPAAHGLLADGILRLSLGSDKKHIVTVGRKVANEHGRFVEVVQGFLQIHDVDPIAFAKDERLHLRVPPPSLVSKVHTRLEQLLHLNRSHVPCLPYRFENWKRLRALG